jgi:hypothetical protein
VVSGHKEMDTPLPIGCALLFPPGNWIGLYSCLFQPHN